MRRLPVFALLIALLAPLAALAQDPPPYDADRYAYERAVYETATPPCLAAYDVFPDGPAARQVTSYHHGDQATRYRPRQFVTGAVVGDATWGNFAITDAGGYAGWDVFNHQNKGSLRAKTHGQVLRLTLHRPCAVALPWRAPTTPLPAWMAPWGGAADTITGNFPAKAAKTHPVYERVVTDADDADAAMPGIQIWIGGSWPEGAPVSGGRDLPFVLIAEADGTPTSPPVLPEGIATEDIPVPNAVCPDWLRGLYSTVGPDGNRYPTHAPTVDPPYWCYNAEHGADPRFFGDGTIFPPFGYAHAKAMEAGFAMPAENPWGYKVEVYRPHGGYQVMRVFHQGTTGLGFACQRYHETAEYVWDTQAGALAMELHFLADFGPAVRTDTGQPLDPAACPGQNTAPGINDGFGSRLVPVGPFGAATQYGPWRDATTKNANLGRAGVWVLRYTDPINWPLDLAADPATMQSHPTGYHSGTNRAASPANLGWTYPAALDPDGDGFWCTDARALAVVECDAAGAIRQFMAPGFAETQVTLGIQADPTNGGATSCVDADRWGRPWRCDASSGSPAETDDAIPPAGPN